MVQQANGNCVIVGWGRKPKANPCAKGHKPIEGMLVGVSPLKMMKPVPRKRPSVRMEARLVWQTWA